MNAPYNIYQEYVEAVLRCAFLEQGYHVDGNALQDGRRYALLCRKINEAPSVGVLFKSVSDTGLIAAKKAITKRSGFVVHTVVVPDDRYRVAFDPSIREILEASRLGPRFLSEQRSLNSVALSAV